MPRKEVISDVRENCPCFGIQYCPLEPLVSSLSERLFEQHKCVEIFKWKESQKRGSEIDWKEIYVMWVELGYAKAFAEVYKDGMFHNEIYEKMLEKINQIILTDKDIIK